MEVLSIRLFPFHYFGAAHTDGDPYGPFDLFSVIHFAVRCRMSLCFVLPGDSGSNRSSERVPLVAKRALLRADRRINCKLQD